MAKKQPYADVFVDGKLVKSYNLSEAITCEIDIGIMESLCIAMHKKFEVKYYGEEK